MPPGRLDSAMSDLKPKAAKTIAVSGRRFGSSLFLALVLITPVKVSLAQSNNGAVLNNQSVVNPPHSTSNLGDDPISGGYDSLIADRRMKLMNNERRKSLVSESDKLIKLATELNNEIAHSNSGSLTPDQLRKVAEIEKLARNIRDKMTMTMPSTSVNLFPIYGPHFSQ